MEPDILFLDEPFSSLDLPSREALMEDLEVELRRTQTTAVLATHDRTEALRLSDRMAVMNAGKILQIGPPAQVIEYPANAFVASFVGVENICRGKVLQNKDNRLIISIGGWQIEALGNLPEGKDVTVCLRPEKIFLSPDRALEHRIYPNRLRMPIKRVVFAGTYAKVYMDGTFPRVAMVDRRDLQDGQLQAGQMVWASFASSSIHLLPSESMGT